MEQQLGSAAAARGGGEFGGGLMTGQQQGHANHEGLHRPLSSVDLLRLQVALEPTWDAMHQISQVQFFTRTMSFPRINYKFGRHLLVF